MFKSAILAVSIPALLISPFMAYWYAQPAKVVAQVKPILTYQQPPQQPVGPYTPYPQPTVFPSLPQIPVQGSGGTFTLYSTLCNETTGDAIYETAPNHSRVFKTLLVNATQADIDAFILAYRVQRSPYYSGLGYGPLQPWVDPSVWWQELFHKS